MKSGKIILFISWLLAVALLFFITVTTEKRTDQFMGLTESKEKVINFTYPVQLKKINVLPGQKVKKGDIIAQVLKTEIYSSKVNTLDYQIDEINGKSKSQINKLQSELDTIEIKENSDISKIDYQIKQIQQKEQQRIKLLSSLANISQNRVSTTSRYKLQSLEKEKLYIRKLAKTKKDDILKQLQQEESLTKSSLAKIKDKKNFILQEEVIIQVKAPIDGEIGSIRFNEQESLKSFETLMTMHTKYPSYVTGYIHENVADQLEIGQEVEIEYVTDKYQSGIGVMDAKVKTISSRIVNFPVRLKKYKVVPLWGYKIHIELPENKLKLGQKVMISSELKKDSFDAKLSKILQFLKLK